MQNEELETKPKIFLAPMSSYTSQKNFKHSLSKGIEYKKIEPSLNKEDKEALKDKKILFFWGNTSSKKNSWEKMKKGDYILFYNHGKYILAGQILYKTHNKKLANNVWGINEKGESWEYIYFIENLQKIDIDHELIKKIGEYKPGFILQGFMPLNEKGMKRIYENYKSIENFLKNKKDNSIEKNENSEFESFYKLAKEKKNIILYGPPGTSKTYRVKEYSCYIIIKDNFQDLLDEYNMLIKKRRYDNISKDELQRLNEIFKKCEDFKRFVQFHPSYAYEDFIEGIRPETEKDSIKYSIKNGVFKEFCKNIKEGKTYVFIIDEINRGNLSKIFGELIFAIESTHRDENVTLQYSKNQFKVPNNLIIIGTMNTADRSIALIDLALRRRFAFKNLMPNLSFLYKYLDINPDDNIEYSDKGRRILSVRALEKINEIILDKQGREKQIGHSFLMPLKKENNEKTFLRVWKYEIIPLIEEYMYFDYTEVKKIFGKLVDLNQGILEFSAKELFEVLKNII